MAFLDVVNHLGERFRRFTYAHLSSLRQNDAWKWNHYTIDARRLHAWQRLWGWTHHRGDGEYSETMACRWAIIIFLLGAHYLPKGAGDNYWFFRHLINGKHHIIDMVVLPWQTFPKGIITRQWCNSYSLHGNWPFIAKPYLSFSNIITVSNIIYATSNNIPRPN